MAEATFDARLHAVTAGWHAYLPPRRRLRGLACLLRGHRWPLVPPKKANGYSPSNYTRCGRCGACGHWYVEGQHRDGGVDRYFADLDAASRGVGGEERDE